MGKREEQNEKMIAGTIEQGTTDGVNMAALILISQNTAAIADALDEIKDGFKRWADALEYLNKLVEEARDND